MSSPCAAAQAQSTRCFRGDGLRVVRARASERWSLFGELSIISKLHQGPKISFLFLHSVATLYKLCPVVAHDGLRCIYSGATLHQIQAHADDSESVPNTSTRSDSCCTGLTDIDSILQPVAAALNCSLLRCTSSSSSIAVSCER
jgi:hypothetical protein